MKDLLETVGFRGRTGTSTGLSFDNMAFANEIGLPYMQMSKVLEYSQHSCTVVVMQSTFAQSTPRLETLERRIMLVTSFPLAR